MFITVPCSFTLSQSRTIRPAETKCWTSRSAITWSLGGEAGVDSTSLGGHGQWGRLTLAHAKMITPTTDTNGKPCAHLSEPSFGLTLA